MTVEPLTPDALTRAADALHAAAARLTRLAEAEALRNLTTGGGGGAGIGAGHVRAAIAARLLWRECTGLAEADPAKALLLELFARRLEGRPIAITALGEAAALPPTTSLSALARLHDTGLIARRNRPGDARAVIVDLTDEAEDRLRLYLGEAMRLAGWVL